jgi:hypothetical protein
LILFMLYVSPKVDRPGEKFFRIRTRMHSWHAVACSIAFSRVRANRKPVEPIREKITEGVIDQCEALCPG